MRALLTVTTVGLTVLAGCGGGLGRLTSAERLPANGAPGGPPAEALKVQPMAAKEWAETPKEKLAATCDARPASAKIDAAGLGDAKKVIDAWAAYRKANPKPPPPSGVTVGDVAGIARNITDRIDAIALNCNAGGAHTLDVNGTSHAFDLAWALVGPAENELAIQAMSLAEKKVVFARLKLPTAEEKAKYKTADADETIVITHVGSYLPANPDEPIVVDGHNKSGKAKTNSPQFETFVFDKGASEGFYYLVPLSPTLSSERYLGVGRFKVGP
jgi:hypothetical protein